MLPEPAQKETVPVPPSKAWIGDKETTLIASAIKTAVLIGGVTGVVSVSDVELDQLVNGVTVGITAIASAASLGVTLWNRRKVPSPATQSKAIEAAEAISPAAARAVADKLGVKRVRKSPPAARREEEF